MLDNFIITLLAILMEAFPFIIIGALLSGIIEEFVPPSLIPKLMPKKLHLSVLIGAVVGIGLPMCECGSVLIVRRLIKKGLPAPAAITYMLSGPIVNPITLASTLTAYSWLPEMVFYRAGTGIIVAIITGLIIHRFNRGETIKYQSGIELEVTRPTKQPFLNRLKHALNHVMDEFMVIFKMLLIGATFAALFKTFAPTKLFFILKNEAWLGIPIFGGLAVILSLCSEADAFISSALAGVFDIPSQVAFLTIGPMLDLKLIMMYKAVFKNRVFLLLCTIPPVFITAICFVFKGVF